MQAAFAASAKAGNVPAMAREMTRSLLSNKDFSRRYREGGGNRAAGRSLEALQKVAAIQNTWPLAKENRNGSTQLRRELRQTECANSFMPSGPEMDHTSGMPAYDGRTALLQARLLQRATSVLALPRLTHRRVLQVMQPLIELPRHRADRPPVIRIGRAIPTAVHLAKLPKENHEPLIGPRALDRIAHLAAAHDIGRYRGAGAVADPAKRSGRAYRKLKATSSARTPRPQIILHCMRMNLAQSCHG